MVSVIIPTYNNEKYLAATLQSVLEQTYDGWECILINDGSTDNTAQIALEFLKKDTRFKYAEQANKGVSAARNNGLGLATGEFIQFLDGDDLLEKGKLARQVKLLSENEVVDIVYSNFRHFRGDERPEGAGEYPQADKLEGAGQKIVRHFLKRNFIRMNTPLLRRRVIDKVGNFNESFLSIEDWDFWMRCAANGCYFLFDDTPGANALVRDNPAGLSKNKATMKSYYLPVLQQLFTSGKLSVANTVIVLSRYASVLFDSLAGGSRIILLPQRKILFIFLISLYSLVFLPVYLLIKLRRLL